MRKKVAKRKGEHQSVISVSLKNYRSQTKYTKYKIQIWFDSNQFPFFILFQETAIYLICVFLTKFPSNNDQIKMG